MKKFTAVAGTAVIGMAAAAVLKRIRPPLAPEGSWKDATAKPSTNGTSQA